MRRLAIFERAKGRCHICKQRIQVGEKWDVEHPRALGLLGADDETNMAPAHEKCHDVKTKDDVGQIAKAKRRAAKHHGIRKTPSFKKPPGVRFDWKLGRHVREAT